MYSRCHHCLKVPSEAQLTYVSDNVNARVEKSAIQRLLLLFLLARVAD